MKTLKNKPKHIPRLTTFEIVDASYSSWSPIKAIRSYHGSITQCPKCGGPLEASYTLIPLTQSRRVKVPGFSCKKCHCIYTDQPKEVKRFLLDKPRAEGFTLDGVELWKETAVKEQRKYQARCMELLRKVRSSKIVLTVRFSGNGQKPTYILIVNSPADASPEEHIYEYASEAGREFLTAAYAQERDKRGTFQGVDYRVIQEPFCKRGETGAWRELVFPHNITIGVDGGYIKSVRNNNFEVINLLLYSPITKKYEIMRATYAKLRDICFTDFGLFRRFVCDYGNPGLPINLDLPKTYFRDFNDLNEESVLRMCGYTVNQADNHSPEYRQKLLADIIDLKILETPRLARFLDFLIASHPQHPVAQAKWEDDKRFVQDYEPNPARFLIAKQG